jgi:hypothetical protein
LPSPVVGAGGDHPIRARDHPIDNLLGRCGAISSHAPWTRRLTQQLRKEYFEVKLVIKIALGIILAVIVMTAGCSALLASDPEVRKATAALEDATATPEQSEPAEPAEPAETAGQDNARRSAENYLDISAFSRKGLIEQLSSDYGEGFSKADAIYAVNHINVDWNEQAAKSA